MHGRLAATGPGSHPQQRHVITGSCSNPGLTCASSCFRRHCLQYQVLQAPPQGTASLSAPAATHPEWRKVLNCWSKRSTSGLDPSPQSKHCESSGHAVISAFRMLAAFTIGQSETVQTLYMLLFCKRNSSMQLPLSDHCVIHQAV